MLTAPSDRPLQASEVKTQLFTLSLSLCPALDDLFMAHTGGRMSYRDASIIKGLISAFHCYFYFFFFEFAAFQNVYIQNLSVEVF